MLKFGHFFIYKLLGDLFDAPLLCLLLFFEPDVVLDFTLESSDKAHFWGAGVINASENIFRNGHLELDLTWFHT